MHRSSVPLSLCSANQRKTIASKWMSEFLGADKSHFFNRQIRGIFRSARCSGIVSPFLVE